MIYKGRIISLERNYAIVITNEMEYFKIKKKDCLRAGNEIIFLSEDIYINRNSDFSTFIRYAASFLLVIFTLSLLFHMNINNPSYGSAVALVSIDINPSIELAVDSDNRVVDVNPINSEGMEIAKEDLIGKDIFDSILALVETAKDKNYIKSDNMYMLISLVLFSENSSLNIENLKGEIDNRVVNDLNLRNLNIVYLKANYKNIENAREERISIGKYEIYRNLNNNEQEIELGTFKCMGIKDLLEIDQGLIQNKNKSHEKYRNTFMYKNENYESECQEYMKSIKQRRAQFSTNNERNHERGVMRHIKESEKGGLLQEDTIINEAEAHIGNQGIENSNFRLQEGDDISEGRRDYGIEDKSNSNSEKNTKRGPRDKGRNSKK